MPIRHLLFCFGGLLMIVSGALYAARSDEAPPSPWLVFASDRNGNWDIFRMRVDGEGVRQLTHQRGQYTWPAWSPDGTWIAYIYERFNDRQIYRMRPTGNDRQQLTHQEQVSPPIWSTDSQWIAFTALRSGKLGIYRMAADGSELLWLTVRPRGVLAFQWAGEWLMAESIYRSDLELYRIHMSGNPTVRTTYNQGQDGNAVGSPDGEWIAFISERDGVQTLYRMRPEGDEAIGLGPARGQPFWSPNGTWIGFLWGDEGGPGIYRVRPGGAARERLATTTGDESFLSWSPDGRWIVFVSPRDGLDNLYLARVADGKVVQLTANQGHNISPSWGPIVEIEWDPRLVLGSGLVLMITAGILHFVRRVRAGGPLRRGLRHPPPANH